MSPRRGAGAPGRFQHFSLSATDEEWEVVRANAARRRVSMARYLVELGLAGERAEAARPPPALAPGGQRGVEEAMRVLRSLAGGGGADTRTLIEKMQGRVAVLVDAWAVAMAREGRLEEVRAAVTGRAGASKAEGFIARIAALAAAPAPHPARGPGPRSAPKEPPDQGTLNLGEP